MSLPSRLAVDSACIIYMIETPLASRGAFMSEEVFDGSGREVVASTIALSEYLVRPFMLGTAAEVAEAREAFENLEGIEIWPVASAIAQEAARLRAADRRLRLPDAIHIATAAVAGVEAFLTNDARLKSSAVAAAVPVLVLDEIAGTG